MNLPAPICPRCDYDLSGEVATWATECPVHGRCSECGLDFDWTSIWRVEPTPHWSIEHRPGPLDAGVAWGWLRAFRPWSLWRDLTLGMPVRMDQLWRSAAVWGVVFTVIAIGIRAFCLAIEAAASVEVHRRLVAMLRVQDPSYVPAIVPDEPLAYLASNPMAWLSPYFHAPRTFGPGVAPSYVFLAGLVWATAILGLVLLPMSLRRARVRLRHVGRLLGYWLIWLPVIAFIPSLTNGVFRAAGSIGELVRLAPPGARVTPWREAVASTLETLALRQWAIASVGVGVVLVIFWFFAIGRYLRVPGAWRTTLGLVTFAVLFSTAAGYFVFGLDDEVTEIVKQFVGV